MNRRTFRFGSRDQAGRPTFWEGEPGDVVEQTGPRIGTRYWLVEDVEDKKVWTHVTASWLDPMFAAEAIIQAGHGHVWSMT